MRCALCILVILCLSVTGWGYPRRAFPELPGATTLGDPGETAVSVLVVDRGPIVEVGRAIDRRLDVWARVGGERPFSLWARAVILEDLGPLSVALDLAADRVALDACLFLGPVHLDWGRSLAAVPRRWGILTVSPDPWLSLVLGVDLRPGTGELVAGARVAPWACGPILSLFVRDRRLSAAIEVAW